MLWLLSGTALAQKGGVKGKLTDEVTGEGLIGATISAGSTKAVATDVDGNFELKLEDGDYTIKITYVGYEPIEKTVSIKGKFIEIIAPLKTKTLREVEIVADIAVARKTPVAFTNITPLKIQEQLGNMARARQAISEFKVRAVARQQEYRKEIETQMAETSKGVQAAKKALRL
ncbi:MAG: hypothetical protein EBZ77_15590 [Chitinophagia bacterium]|nr:hypothetical protein [Chitinophagia bacterium]